MIENKKISGLEFYPGEGQAIRALSLEIVKVSGKFLKGHQGQDM